MPDNNEQHPAHNLRRLGAKFAELGLNAVCVKTGLQALLASSECSEEEEATVRELLAQAKD